MDLNLVKEDDIAPHMEANAEIAKLIYVKSDGEHNLLRGICLLH